MTQVDLFAVNEQLSLPMEDGELLLIPQAFSSDVAASLFAQLRQQAEWSQDGIRIAGRQVPIPRLQAWYGDGDAYYSYSGLSMQPLSWTKTLLEIKHRIEILTEGTFNSVLLNLYRDGSDSVGWHCDDEPELGCQPVIASLSLGASRHFSLRHKKPGHKTIKLLLNTGDLLVMSGALQQNWQHQLPKTRLPVAARINLTFRWVQPTI